MLGSERLVGATLDRLTHRGHILGATGGATGSAMRNGVRGLRRERRPGVREQPHPTGSEDDEGVGPTG